MLTGGRSHERVVDGTAGDPQSRELGAKTGRLGLAQELRCGEVARQQADGVGRRAAKRSSAAGILRDDGFGTWSAATSSPGRRPRPAPGP